MTISIFIQFIIQIFWVSDRKLLCTPTEEGSPNHPLAGYPRYIPGAIGPSQVQPHKPRGAEAQRQMRKHELRSWKKSCPRRATAPAARGDAPPGEPAPESHWEGADRSTTVRDAGEERVFGIAQDLLWVFMGRNQRQEKERIYMTHG